MTAKRTSGLRVICIALASAWAIASPGSAAMVPTGPEFGPFGLSAAADPQVCGRPGGGFAQVFRSLSAQPGSSIQFLDSAGFPVGGEFAVLGSTYISVFSISCAANGDVYVAWYESGTAYGRRYDATGAPLGSPIAFLLPTAGAYIEAIVLAPDGKVVALGRRINASDQPVLLRVFAQDGTPLGPETTTGVITDEYEITPIDVSHEGDGEFVVARLNMAQRFDALGNALGPVAPFGLDLPGFSEVVQQRIRLCRQPSGNLVAVGHTRSYSPEDAVDVYARIFDSDLQPLGASFMVNIATADSQYWPYVACADGGGFVVAWHDEIDSDLHARQFDASGSPLGVEFYASEERRGYQGEPGRQAIAVSGSYYLFTRNDYAGPPGPGIRARTYCDDSTVGCTYTCPGSATDADADGFPDACDPCTNVGGAQTTESAKLFLKRKHAYLSPFSELARFSQMKLSGEVTLPAGFGGFAAIDPLSQPVRVRIEGEADTTILDSILTTNVYAGTGTAGWTSKSAGRVWDYRSRELFPVEGIVSVRLKSGPDDTVRLTVKAKGKTDSLTVEYPYLETDVPPRAIVAFGPPSVAATGGCTETGFAPVDCSYSQVDTDMRTLGCR